MPAARSSRVPITTRSGCMKSSIADPSRRNSGLLTTAKVCLLLPAPSRRIASIMRPVPIGTVLLVMMIL